MMNTTPSRGMILALVLFFCFMGPFFEGQRLHAAGRESRKPENGTEGAKQVLHIWHTELEPQSIAAMEHISAKFEKLNPGVKVKQVALGWNELEARLMAAIATGNMPDLAHGQAITCAAFYRKDLLRPLDDVVETVGADNIWDGVKAIGYHAGHHYGLAHAAGTSLLIYRRDLFEQKNLTPPQTWKEFLTVLDALTEDTDGDGTIDRYGLLIPGSKLFLNIGIGELFKSNGGRFFDDHGRPALTGKPMIALLEFYRQLTRYMPPDWVRYEYADTFKVLAEGKVAMLYQGYGRGVGYIKKYAPPEMADAKHFAVMQKPHGPFGKNSAAQVDAEPWMIFKNAKNPDLAAAFLKFFYKDENYIEYIASVPIHFFPVTKSLRESSAYGDLPMIAQWGQWLDVQQYYLSNDFAKPTLVTEWKDLEQRPYLMEVLDSGILSDMVLDVCFKGIPPEVAAARAQTKMEQFLKTIR